MRRISTKTQLKMESKTNPTQEGSTGVKAQVVKELIAKHNAGPGTEDHRPKECHSVSFVLLVFTYINPLVH